MAELTFQAFHVLAVDDDDLSLRLVGKLLTDLAVGKVATARNGSEALSVLLGATRPFDFILCDLKMPNGNGLQILKMLRCGEIKNTRPDTCFIFTTAVSDPPSVKIAAQLDASGYLVKPITLERLRTTMTRAKSKYFKVDVLRYAQTVVPESAL